MRLPGDRVDGRIEGCFLECQQDCNVFQGCYGKHLCHLAVMEVN